MGKTSTIKLLNKAKENKNDEFYTRIEDIENEMEKHIDKFKNKIIYLPCDDPHLLKEIVDNKDMQASQFWTYFHKNFSRLGIKKLIATYYNDDSLGGIFESIEPFSNKYIYEGGNDQDVHSYKIEQILGNGDFRSNACKDIMKESDLIITNPPFSLFQEFLFQIQEFKKDFIIVGSNVAVAKNRILPLINSQKVFISNKYLHCFNIIENGKMVTSRVAALWFASWLIDKPKTIKMTKKYTPEEYPFFDNEKIINIDSIRDIPSDYYDLMGVPISYLIKHSPDQFKIFAIAEHKKLNGNALFTRIIIKRKQHD